VSKSWILFTIKVLETTIEPTIPASTPKPSPGFGIVVAIVVVVSAIYIRGKRR